MRSSAFIRVMSLASWSAWYTGTVPIGTGEASMMALRMASMFPPVDRSITVSAPCLRQIASFPSSLSTWLVTALLPMFALTLHARAMPIPIGSRFGWLTFAGMISRPRATSPRTSSGATFSRSAT